MPLTRAFISPEELYPDKPATTYEDVARLAASLNRSEALHFLAYLNLLLSSASTETEMTGRLEPIHEIQTVLFREVVSESLLRDLKAKFREESLLDRPILHRTQLLFAIRVVATHGNGEGGNMLAERRDFDLVGDLLFQINGLFRVDPASSEASTTLWMATQIGPLYETENPPDVQLSWPRIQELLVDRLPAAAVDPVELERLEQVTVFTTGFGIQAWIDLTWMLFSFWAAVTFKELMNNRGRGYINLGADHKIISKELLERALNALAVPFDDLPNHLKLEAYSRTSLFDLTPFRSKPLWLMPDGRVLCVDTALLMERLGPHVFWAVTNALDTFERRRQFSSTWGLAFESYVLDRLAQICGGKKWSFVRNPTDTSNGEELIDAVAVRERAAFLVECKGTFVTTADKYSGVPGRFMRGLTNKFGRAKHGGVHQLIRAISHIWFDRTGSDSITDSDKMTDVFPVLVVQDPIVGCGPVAKVLCDRFAAGIARARRKVTHKCPTIWPLLVLTADDLDRMTAAARLAHGFAPVGLFKRYHRSHPIHLISFGEFLSSKGGADMVPPDQLKPTLTERFTTATQGTLQRFRAGEYGGEQPAEHGRLLAGATVAGRYAQELVCVSWVAYCGQNMEDMILVKDLPPDLIEAVIQDLACYTIAFLQLRDVGRECDADLLGSGVLVAAGNQRAILTAHHVVTELPSTGRIGLFLDRTTQAHTIDIQGISVVPIARGAEDSIGPDIAAVVLAPQIAGSIAAKKSFFNLDSRRDWILNDPPDLRDGVWVAQGFLEERTVVRPDPIEDGPTKYFYNFTGMGGPEVSPRIGDHDYLEFPVGITARDQAPVSWGGMSGGGLWQVRLKREDGHLRHMPPILAGIMFYQHPTTPTECGVRGHGRHSVYEVAYRAIRPVSAARL